MAADPEDLPDETQKETIFVKLLATVREGEAEAREFGDKPGEDDLQSLQNAADDDEGDFTLVPESEEPPEEPGAQSPSAGMATARDETTATADPADDDHESDDAALTEAELKAIGGPITEAEHDENQAACSPAQREALYQKKMGIERARLDSAGTGEAGAEPPSRDTLNDDTQARKD